jgi:hypothetical protein
MKESHELLEEVIDRVGVKKVAADVGVSSSLVYKWCQEKGDDHSGANNPLDRLCRIIDSTEGQEIVDWLCAKSGGYFVEDGECEDGNIDTKYIEQTQQMIQRFSSLLDIISKSLANDNRIDKQEADNIIDAWHKLKSQGEAFVNACKCGAFDRK